MLRHLLTTLRRGFDSLVYPATCLFCKAYHEAEPPWVCAPCQRQLWQRGLNLRLDLTVAEYGVMPVFSCWPFDDGMQELIHRFKYKHGISLGSWLGELLALQARRYGMVLRRARFVPVPIHKRRRRERGFNQTELLCQGLLTRFPRAIVDPCLYRRRYTASQTGLSPGDRLRNVLDAFALATEPEQIAGADFVLVDDVATTGATLIACAGVLFGAGARRVRAITLCLA